MSGARARFEEVEHTADLALRIHGRTLRELFANAAYAMFSQLADLDRIVPTVTREVTVEGIDYESLLVNWLNELLYLQDTRSEAYASFQIHRLSRRQLQATVCGGKTESIHTLIKATTYHGLSIDKIQGRYTSTVVFDV